MCAWNVGPAHACEFGALCVRMLGKINESWTSLSAVDETIAAIYDQGIVAGFTKETLGKHLNIKGLGICIGKYETTS